MDSKARTLLMGVLNVTPDSFSDGGRFIDPAKALAHVWTLAAEGADIVDIGAESSRPGAVPVDLEIEWCRLQPVLEILARENVPIRISIDSYKPEIMRRAAEYPIHILNDIRGGADPETLAFLAARGFTYLAMHMHKDPKQMQGEPLEGRLALNEVADFYQRTERMLLQAGFSKDRIWLDPGIGFGKTDRANLLLLKQAFTESRHRSIVLGVSRKSFIGRLLDIEAPRDRDVASKMLELSFLLADIKVIRTHEVKKLRDFRAMLNLE